jgi:membrane protease YdiL (CAAX protease family)
MMETRGRGAFWDYWDLAVFIGSLLPVYLTAQLLLLAGNAALPSAFQNQSVRLLVFQSALYVLLLVSLMLVIKTRYGMPLWSSLGWTPAFRGAWWCVLGAPVLAFTITVVGVLIKTPIIPTPAEQLLGGDGSLIAVGLLTTLVGPVFEELIFRGFLQPLLARSWGDLPAIAGAAVPFALLHGVQSEWSWQHLSLIFLAGSVFGWAKYRTGSTAGSALMHMGYNLTLFTAFVIQRQLR